MMNNSQAVTYSPNSLATTQVAQSRELQEIKLRFEVANMFPRQLAIVRQNIAEECRDREIAEAAEYAFSRGGAVIKGPSIKLMEAIAKHYGNIETGTRILERRVGSSTVEVYALDLQTNTRKNLTFDVKHIRDTKNGGNALTDERDINEMEANWASRRLRKCLEALIPKSIIEEAIKICRETVDAGIGGKKPSHEKQVENFLKAFLPLGVSRENIEFAFGKTMEEFSSEDFSTLRGYGTSIKDGQQSVGEIFPDLAIDFPASKELISDETNEG